MSDAPIPKRSGAEPLAVAVSNRQDLPVDEEGLAALAGRALRGEGRRTGELSLSFVTAAEMEDLHLRYIDEPGSTDVLSFTLDEEGLIGDVVVCPEVAVRNNVDVEAELRLLVVHGVLHVLGYDHQQDDDRRDMWARQERYSGVRAP